METTNEMPIITLKNGIRVGNFSSPHPFTFTSGEVLPACSEGRTKNLMLQNKEVEHDNGRWVDIELSWEMSDEVAKELNAIAKRDDVDIVLVPFPIMTAVKETNTSADVASIILDKIRVCRSADRVTKTIYPNRFCT